MRRRFGRGRRSRSSGEAKNAPIDSSRAFERLIAAGAVDVPTLEPAGDEDIATDYAAVGIGEQAGETVVVGFAPGNAGDALFATLAVAQRLAEGGFRGDAVAVAPQWSGAARQRLSVVAREALPYRLSALANTALADDRGVVVPDVFSPATLVPPERVAARLGRSDERALFRRATQALEGLAAKHGGAVRALNDRVELVLLARRVAALRARENGVQLEVLQGERSTKTLASETLATAMDQLEGLLRKRLNDRRVRGGEEGLRAQLGSALAEVAGVRSPQFWPLGGSDSEIIDFVGVHDDGCPVVAAIRNRVSLADLGALVDAAMTIRPALGLTLAAAGPPLRLDAPRLLLAAKEFDAAALRVLASLSLDHALYDVEVRRGRDPMLLLRDGVAPLTVAVGAEPAADGAVEEPTAEAPGRSRSRRRRGGRRSRGPVGETGEETAEAPASLEGGAASLDFEEVSLFDLAEDTRSGSEGGEGGSRRGRRGRGRRRRGRGGADREDAGPSDEDELAEPVEAADVETTEGEERPSGRRPSRGRRRGRGGGEAREQASDDDESTDDIDDLSDGLAPLEDLPGLDEPAVPAYDDEEEDEDDRSRRRREAEDRARARGDQQPDPAAEEIVSLPRKRACIVVHADRSSLICGILLARDLHQIEGLWVYEQQDLMTFFRGVATDLREDTTIYVIGFTASPARDAVQAASLYRGRLAWFDHHEWPPEDLGAMAEVIGRDNLHVTPGAENSLSEVLAVRTRRSRFSDKVVELLTGSFSQHDYERWGRLWWHKLGEIAKRTGERRADVDPLLIGRPSDLAKQAALLPVPPPPPEVAYVSERDFRLVHFGGYTMAVVTVPEHLDAHLVSRVARERYQAEISVAGIEGTDLVILGGDEGRDRRNLSLMAMVEHLVAKFDWVTELSAEDHVARMRIRDFAVNPGHFDELISEIAMGRSILEG